MPRISQADKMTALLKKQEEIANQLKQLKAREKDSERKADTRRKVIAGALALEHLDKQPNSEFAKVLFKLLDDYVEPRSRHLFSFLAKRESTQDNAAPAAGSSVPPPA